jgi:hypothetical protein
MTLPFVLVGKCALAAGEIEHTEEGRGVCLSGVALECSYIFKGGVVAGLADDLTSVFDCQRTLCRYSRLVALVRVD